MTPKRIPATPTVVVISGDAIVGQALELLLRNTDYDVKFLAEPSLDDTRLLEGVQLLVLAPGLGDKRKALLELVDSAPSRVPILELVDDVQTAQARPGYFVVPWPCRTQELKRQIKATLLAKPKTNRAGQRDPLTHQKPRKRNGA